MPRLKRIWNLQSKVDRPFISGKRELYLPIYIGFIPPSITEITTILKRLSGVK